MWQLGSTGMHWQASMHKRNGTYDPRLMSNPVYAREMAQEGGGGGGCNLGRNWRMMVDSFRMLY